jgi:uncharacterized DUF497 family protein
MVSFDRIVGFEWDAGNERKSEVKRRVTQSEAEAEEIFFDKPLLISMNESYGTQEPRFIALGKTQKARGLTVVFTLRQDATLIRVISARDQHRKERQLYEQAQR